MINTAKAMDLLQIDSHITAIDNNLLDTVGIGMVYVVRGDQIALIETGTPRSVQYILAGLAHLGVAPEAIKHIVCTHNQMNHGGGSGVLEQALTQANVYIHSTMMPHLI